MKRKREREIERERGGRERKIEHGTANVGDWEPRRRPISVTSA